MIHIHYLKKCLWLLQQILIFFCSKVLYSTFHLDKFHTLFKQILTISTATIPKCLNIS